MSLLAEQSKDRGRNGRRPLRGLGIFALAAVVGSVLMAGCGFELRGTTEIPAELGPILIAAQDGTATGGALLQRLRGSGVPITNDRQEARMTLRVLREGRSSRVVAVDRNGKVLAYELGFETTFDAVGTEGEALLAPQTVSLQRTLDNPDIEVLGKQEETELIYQDMEREAAELVLLRLRAALS